MFTSSPEELETLLEDAVLMGDEAAVAALFDEAGVVIAGPRIAGPEQALVELAALGHLASSRAITVRRCVAVAVRNRMVTVVVGMLPGAGRHDLHRGRRRPAKSASSEPTAVRA
ncbi:MAG: hypothetical protein NVS3B26_07200 [Mycobacteriales bacterium]